MKKMHGTAIWNDFSEAQKETIEEWMFLKNMTYAAIRRETQKVFGVGWSLASIQRTYKYLAQMRALADLTNAIATSGKLQANGDKTGELRDSIQQMAATRLLEQAIEKGDRRDVSVYGRIVMQGETSELERERLALAIKKHEFKASEAALKALPLVDEFTQDDEERERARVATIRRILFGGEKKEETKR